MVLRREEALRVVDAFDLEQPAPLSFRFVTPMTPQRLMDGVRLGPVDLRWEEGLACDIAPLGLRFPGGDASGEALYRISLNTPGPVGRGFFTFSLTSAR